MCTQSRVPPPKKMSSSNHSGFSISSQRIIGELEKNNEKLRLEMAQEKEKSRLEALEMKTRMDAMERLLAANAVVVPDAAVAVGLGEAMEVDLARQAKKRQPSGSPSGKFWDASGSDSGSEVNDCEGEDWRLVQLKKGRKKEKKEMKERSDGVKKNKIQKRKNKNKSADVVTSPVPLPVLLLATAPTTVPNMDPSLDPEVYVSPARAPLFSEALRNGMPTNAGGQLTNAARPPVPAFASVFKTPMPDGPFRDEVVVEVNSINGQQYTGTVTPTEARKVIFEDMLGFAQNDLASVTIGFNRGRIITFKLKQQVDIDLLYECENFEFERSVGQDVSLISCKIRGVRNPANRTATPTRTARFAGQPLEQYTDDGTRTVRVIGCEYRLTESQILNWLVIFGEVISEITEEPFEEVQGSTVPTMPPVGNGTYVVTMKLKKDLPNWIPMYGRKICLEYRGIRRQCNSCYGNHIKKNCRWERVSMEQLADKIRSKYPEIPEEYFGRLAKPVPIQNPAADETQIKDHAVQDPSATAGLITGAVMTAKASEHASAPLRISFRKNSDAVWTRQGSSTQDKPSTVLGPSTSDANPTMRTSGSVTGVAPTFIASTRVATENAVSSMMSVLRASFKPSVQDSVINENVVDSEESQYTRDRNVRGGNVPASNQKPSTRGHSRGRGAGNQKSQ